MRSFQNTCILIGSSLTLLNKAFEGVTAHYGPVPSHTPNIDNDDVFRIKSMRRDNGEYCMHIRVKDDPPHQLISKLCSDDKHQKFVLDANGRVTSAHANDTCLKKKDDTVVMDECKGWIPKPEEIIFRSFAGHLVVGTKWKDRRAITFPGSQPIENKVVTLRKIYPNNPDRQLWTVSHEGHHDHPHHNTNPHPHHSPTDTDDDDGHDSDHHDSDDHDSDDDDSSDHHHHSSSSSDSGDHHHHSSSSSDDSGDHHDHNNDDDDDDLNPQKRALKALYDNTDGGNWDNNKGWKNGNGPVCGWHGIKCTDDDSVEKIELEDNNLSGNLPTELGLLSNVKRLVLYNNRLSGGIPSEIGQMESLEELHLLFNLLDKLPDEIGNLKSLTTLELSNNRIEGTLPTNMGKMEKIVHIYLENNKLSGSIPTELGDLEKLNSLYLKKNNIIGTVPEEVCDLKLDHFVVDLQKVDCDCCTNN